MSRTREFANLSAQKLKTRIKKINRIIGHMNQMERYRDEIRLINMRHYLDHNLGKIIRIDEANPHEVLNMLVEYFKASFSLGRALSALEKNIESLPEPNEYEFDLSKLCEQFGGLEGLKYPWHNSGFLNLYRRNNMRESLSRAIEKWRSELKALEAALRIVTARKKKEQKLKAHAAAHHGKTRDLADSVRKQISDQFEQHPNCPYCFGKMGNSPHADHIYPVSKGGLSTKENMVFICEKCNMDKGDLTLREFIKKNELNSNKIENILEKLGKEF